MTDSRWQLQDLSVISPQYLCYGCAEGSRNPVPGATGLCRSERAAGLCRSERAVAPVYRPCRLATPARIARSVSPGITASHSLPAVWRLFRVKRANAAYLMGRLAPVLRPRPASDQQSDRGGQPASGGAAAHLPPKPGERRGGQQSGDLAGCGLGPGRCPRRTAAGCSGGRAD